MEGSTVYACTMLLEGGMCGQWVQISLPTVDPSLWAPNASLGFGVVLGFFMAGAMGGFLLKLGRM